MSDKSVKEVRRDFPVLRKRVYLNNASCGAGSRSVWNATMECAQDIARSRLEADYSLEKWVKRLQETRKQFAKLIGARSNEIFWMPSTTTGLNVVANTVDFKPGKNIVTNDMEFVPNVIVWLKQRERGADVRVVKSRNGQVSPDDISKAVDRNTSVLAVGQVGWYNGFRHDLRALSGVAHDRGAYVVVDGIQAVGALRIDVDRDGIDFLACGTHKWLLGPGGAFLYVRRDIAETFKPPFMYSHVVKKQTFETYIYDGVPFYDLEYAPPGDLQLELGFRRQDFDVFNLPQYAGAWAAMNIILEYGQYRVERRVERLTNYLVERLLELNLELQTPSDPSKRFGIVNFRCRKNRSVEKQLAERDVIVSARCGGVRVSPHFFNIKEEIDRLTAELRRIRKHGSDL